MIKKLNYLFVSCFGIGSFRFAPGTITSLVTVIFLYSLFHIINLSINTIFIFLFIIFIYSFYAVAKYIKNNENKYPKEVVIDDLMDNQFQFIFMKFPGITKEPQDAVYFIFIFLFYLDFWY